MTRGNGRPTNMEIGTDMRYSVVQSLSSWETTYVAAAKRRHARPNRVSSSSYALADLSCARKRGATRKAVKMEMIGYTRSLVKSLHQQSFLDQNAFWQKMQCMRHTNAIACATLLSHQTANGHSTRKMH